MRHADCLIISLGPLQIQSEILPAALTSFTNGQIVANVRTKISGTFHKDVWSMKKMFDAVEMSRRLPFSWLDRQDRRLDN